MIVGHRPPSPFPRPTFSDLGSSCAPGSGYAEASSDGRIGKSKVINRAIQDIGMGRYNWQLFVLCGFGWLTDKWVHRSVCADWSILLIRMLRQFLVAGRRSDVALHLPRIWRVDHQGAIHHLCRLRWTLRRRHLLGCGLRCHRSSHRLQHDPLLGRRLWPGRRRRRELGGRLRPLCLYGRRCRGESSRRRRPLLGIPPLPFGRPLDDAVALVAGRPAARLATYVHHSVVPPPRLASRG